MGRVGGGGEQELSLDSQLPLGTTLVNLTPRLGVICEIGALLMSLPPVTQQVPKEKSVIS